MEKKTETEETMAAHTLETERLLVRPFQEEDAEAFLPVAKTRTWVIMQDGRHIRR